MMAWRFSWGQSYIKFKIMKLKWIIWAVIAIAVICHWGFMGVIASGFAFVLMLDEKEEDNEHC